MLVCSRCHSLCGDSAMRCPNCRSNKLREADGEDYVFLRRADLYTAQRLQEMFGKQGVACRLEEFGRGQAGYFYDSEVMPTDKSVLVRYADLPAARELSARLREEPEQGTDTEEFEDMPRKKRLFVQALSIVAFLAIVMLTVFAADGVASWLKGLLGLP